MTRRAFIATALGVGIVVMLGAMCYPLLSILLRPLVRDVFESARVTIPSKWSVSETPTVVVSTFRGAIFVEESVHGTVEIEILCGADCKNLPEAEARRALGAIATEATRDGNIIRVGVKRARSLPKGVYAHAAVYIHVPPGSRLKVETEGGSMSIKGSFSEVIATNAYGAVGADFVVTEADRENDAPNEFALAKGKVAVIGGVLYIDGASRAKVSSGDRITLTDDKLLLNGQTSLP
jgi:hypothetical protein